MDPQQPDITTSAAIDQIKQREAQWRRVGGLLHRLLTELSRPAATNRAQVDGALGELRNLLQQSTDPSRVPVLLKALAKAVGDIDTSVPATAPPAGTPALDELLLAMIDRLELDDGAATELHALRREIASCEDATALRDHGSKLIELVSRQLRRLAQDRRAALRVLHEIGHELSTMAGCIERDAVNLEEDASASRDASKAWLDDVEALDECLETATDLAELRVRLKGHLATIRGRLDGTHQRERAREDAWRQRVDNLRRRVQKLEQSTRDMETMLVTKGHLLDTDALTGLANRRALDARMQTLKAPATGTLCVLMMDIDHFKGINDRLGHGAGDRALRIVAEQLQATLRPGDFLARYGGEEFVAILEADLDEALEIADRLRARLERTRFRSQEQPVQLTLSCGVTTVRADDTAESVIERADQALYRAKRAGRNRCETL